MAPERADDSKQRVAAHWDRRAAHFDEDFGHSIGSPAERAAWDRILDLVIPPISPGGGPLDALDAGCGTGFLALELAARGHRVTGIDFAPSMVARAQEKAAASGLAVRFEQGDAENLPYPNGSFDLVISRYSAHHWSDLGVALREVRRVLKPGGVAAFIDVLSPGSPLFDTYLQSVEVLRDTSHVRDYSAGEWLRQVSEAGLHTRSTTRQRLRLEYNSWVERMRTPEVMRAAIRQLQQSMGNEVREYFEIEADGSFSTDVLVLWAEK